MELSVSISGGPLVWLHPLDPYHQVPTECRGVENPEALPTVCLTFAYKRISFDVVFRVLGLG